MNDVAVRFRFCSDVRVAANGESRSLLLDGASTVQLAPLPGRANHLYTLLGDEGLSEDEIFDLIDEAEDERAVQLVTYQLELFRKHALLEYVVAIDSELELVVEPVDASFRLPTSVDAPALGHRLSRFALLRRDAGAWILESGACNCRLRFSGGDALAAVAELERGAGLASRSVAVRTNLLAGWLASLGFLEQADEPEPPPRRSWEFHDLLFHARSRASLPWRHFGATYRLRGERDPPPALKPPMSEVVTRLAQPPAPPAGSLSAVLDARRSDREHGSHPITVDQLAALLFRIARTREVTSIDGLQLLRRPVPAAGGIQELEFYVAVNRCAGLDPGFYHYRGTEHALYRLAVGIDAISPLLDAAARAWGSGISPQVLLVLTSRLPRLAWKYERIAYRLSLLDAGVVMQSVYLVATDLGLACTALGSGDSRHFNTLTGIDPFEETAIAELCLGSRERGDVER